MVSMDQIAMMENFNEDLYFKALIAVAKADGNLDKNELSFLKDQAHILDYNLEEVISETYDLEQLVTEEISLFTKNTIIKDCISLAFIDDDYDDNERKKIQEIGKVLNISKDKIFEIEKWLEEYWKILKKGEFILSS